MTIQEQEVYNEGYKAWFDGYCPEDNPYRSNHTGLCITWDDGYEQAGEDMCNKMLDNGPIGFTNYE